MSNCPVCSRTIERLTAFCPHCAAPLAQAATVTFTSDVGPLRRRGAPASAVSSLDDRLEPGGLLGGRYRIVGLLGRGGMGEVYRADDLKLGRRVIHRDLKPADVMLGGRGKARITDFGLAGAAGASPDGEVAGTPADRGVSAPTRHIKRRNPCAH